MAAMEMLSQGKACRFNVLIDRKHGVGAVERDDEGVFSVSIRADQSVGQFAAKSIMAALGVETHAWLPLREEDGVLVFDLPQNEEGVPTS